MEKPPDNDTGRWRTLLRSLPGLKGDLPATRLEDFPAEPLAAFLAWLGEVIRHGIAAPHALTLSTVDEAGADDARTLLLKDVDGEGLSFASDPDFVAEHWRAYRLAPRSWEFWQARPDRVQLRVEYTLRDGVWLRRQLQP